LKRRNVLKALHYAKASFSWRKNDVLLVSFPKSGNTWVRYFWINYISQAEWAGKTIDFKTLDNVMPSFGLPNFFNRWRHTSLPKAVASHWTYGPYFSRPKRVFIIRDPRDVMVSYFHYINAKANQPDFVSFSEFIRTSRFGLEAWARHFLSWRDKADYIIKYEDLKSNDIAEFKRMFEHLGISYNEEHLIKAAEASRFDNFRKVEATMGHSKPEANKGEFKFTRKGIVGDYKNYFLEEDERYYYSILQKYNLTNAYLKDE
jgi:hypothetical protein